MLAKSQTGRQHAHIPLAHLPRMASETDEADTIAEIRKSYTGPMILRRT